MIIQLVDQKATVALLPTHRHGIMSATGFCDDAVSYTQQWEFKLAELMAWGIKLSNFRLGV